MFHDRINKKIIIHLAAAIFWLVIWQAASTFAGLEFVLAGPVKVLFCLAEMLCKSWTYVILTHSFLRISAGFLIAFPAAFAAGMLSFYYKAFKVFIDPMVVIMKSLPIAVFIILILMLTGSSMLSLVTSFIVTFPVVYYGVLEGMLNLNSALAEMAYIFSIKGIRKFRFIILPQCMPYVNAAAKTSIGMCWKAGAAAEIIGLPNFSIGEQLYLSKLYLQSDVLLSWGIIIVAAGVVSEKVFLCVFKNLVRLLSGFRHKLSKDLAGQQKIQFQHEKQQNNVYGIRIEKVSKSYDGNKVLDNISLNINEGGRLCLMGKSGIGKTTLMRIILGLEKADCGSVDSSGSFSAVFQESTLCPWLSAADNVCIVMKKGGGAYGYVRSALAQLLDDEAVDKPAASLSGGMKRRCETVRAVLCDSSAVILDEPFAGMDENTKERTIQFILDNINGRTLIVSTHDEDDVKALEAAAFVIDKNDNDC